MRMLPGGKEGPSPGVQRGVIGAARTTQPRALRRHVMTRATAPMTMVVSAPMTQAASRSVAAAASAVLGAEGWFRHGRRETLATFRNPRPLFCLLPTTRHALLPLLFPAPRRAFHHQGMDLLDPEKLQPELEVSFLMVEPGAGGRRVFRVGPPRA